MSTVVNSRGHFIANKHKGSGCFGSQSNARRFTWKIWDAFHELAHGELREQGVGSPAICNAPKIPPQNPPSNRHLSNNS